MMSVSKRDGENATSKTSVILDPILLAIIKPFGYFRL